MNRFIFGSSLLCLLFLLVGTFFFPSSIVMWTAHLELPYTIFRICMVVLLVAVLATTPPRQLYMRILMALAGITLLSIGTITAFTDGMYLLDIAMSFMLGTAFLIEALEYNEDELNERALSLQEQYRKMHPKVPQVQ